MALSDYYGAIGDFNFTLEMDSTLADALNYRGEAKINLGDNDGQSLTSTKAIKYNSKYGEAYTNRGFAKYNNENLQGAYLIFQKPWRLAPPRTISISIAVL